MLKLINKKMQNVSRSGEKGGTGERRGKVDCSMFE